MKHLHIAPHLIPKISYPLVEKGYDVFKFPAWKSATGRRLDRVQIRVGPERFAIMVRHPELGHWCGYVMIPEMTWNAIPLDRLREIRSGAPERLSFAGPANAYISWCMHTKKTNKLSIPISIQADDVDFWVGFSAHGEPPIAEDRDFYSRLLALEEYLWGKLNEDSRS